MSSNGFDNPAFDNAEGILHSHENQATNRRHETLTISELASKRKIVYWTSLIQLSPLNV